MISGDLDFINHMARYYRRRYTRTVVRAPKKKWCSNMISVSLHGTTSLVGEDYVIAIGTDIAENKTETTSPTPIVVKTGNFKVQLDVFCTSVTRKSDMIVYLVYQPEGVAPVGANAVKEYMLKHPEWIIAWKKVDLDVDVGDVTSNSTRITMSSRLKRNLNSGDKIGLYLFSTKGNTLGSEVDMNGMVQFWSCAN